MSAKPFSAWYFDIVVQTLTLLIFSQEFPSQFWFHLAFFLDLFTVSIQMLYYQLNQDMSRLNMSCLPAQGLLLDFLYFFTFLYIHDMMSSTLMGTDIFSVSKTVLFGCKFAFVLFSFVLKTESECVALIGLEFVLYTSLALTCLSLSPGFWDHVCQ